MKIRRAAKILKDLPPALSLINVHNKNKLVETLVEECAIELSSANSDLKQELSTEQLTPTAENAIDKAEEVEDKVHDASEQLSDINLALKNEIKIREILEDQLSIVIDQSDEARHASLHDPLTGLPNRALFHDRLEHGLAQAKRHGYSLAIMFLDLDEFKQINDTHGHDVGDAILQTIATRLKKNTRDDDTICRYGGDEFLYILMEIKSETETKSLARKIINAVKAPCDIQLRDITISLTVHSSIGISIFPKNGTTAQTLLTCADKAMYRAKSNKTGLAFAE